MLRKLLLKILEPCWRCKRIVTPSAELLSPNHYLPVAIGYQLTHRPGWGAAAAVGKTLVSTSMIDRVVQKLGRRLAEVPVGFKSFEPRLFNGSYCFGGEESALLGAGRHGLDHGQGRHHHGFAGGRDYRPHWQGPRRTF